MTAPRDRFTQNLTISLTLHFVLAAVFSIKAYFAPSKPITFERSLKVDIIALPQKRTTPAKPAAKPQPKKVAKKAVKKPVKVAKKAPPKKVPIKKKPTTKKISESARRSQQSDALRKLQAAAAIDALKTIPDETAIKVPPPSSEPVKNAGNILSAGTSLVGTQKLQHDEYLGKLRDHVGKNWFLPEYLAKQNYNAQVLVKLDQNGSLISYEISKSSGNPTFDELVLSTVEKSHPLPKPPQKFTQIVAVDGVLLGFPE